MTENEKSLYVINNGKEYTIDQLLKLTCWPHWKLKAFCNIHGVTPRESNWNSKTVLGNKPMDEEPKKIKRPPGVYNNLPSPYRIFRDDKLK